MTGRLPRYLLAMGWLAAALLPLIYAVFGLILFWTPKTPSAGNPTISDWIWVGLSLAVILTILASLIAHLSQHFRLGWALLGLAYLPLVVLQVISHFSG